MASWEPQSRKRALYSPFGLSLALGVPREALQVSGKVIGQLRRAIFVFGARNVKHVLWPLACAWGSEKGAWSVGDPLGTGRMGTKYLPAERCGAEGHDQCSAPLAAKIC